jgi:hypothetical protein
MWSSHDSSMKEQHLINQPISALYRWKRRDKLNTSTFIQYWKRRDKPASSWTVKSIGPNNIWRGSLRSRLNQKGASSRTEIYKTNRGKEANLAAPYRDPLPNYPCDCSCSLFFLTSHIVRLFSPVTTGVTATSQINKKITECRQMINDVKSVKL